VSVLPAVLALAALVAVFLPGPLPPLVAVAAAVLVALATEPAILWGTFTGRSLTVLLLLVAVPGGAVAMALGPERGLAASLLTLERVVVLALLLAVAARRLDTEALERLAARAGLERLGLVAGLALNAMPHLAEAWRDAWLALAVRRGRSRPRLADLPLLAEVMLAHTARTAEQAAVAAALRGHPAISGTPRPVAVAPQLVVVTGRSGRGKTPAVAAVVDALRAQGVTVVGFQQLPRLTDGKKDGFDVIDLASGARCQLGRWVGPDAGEHGTPFVFSPEGFALARAAVAAIPEGSVLVVDEIGAVELRGAGHWPALERALASPRPAAVVVVARRPLVPALLGRLRAPGAVITDVEAEVDPIASLGRAVRTRLRTRA
jgi:nucleoside-triphosphatase THEP1